MASQQPDGFRYASLCFHDILKSPSIRNYILRTLSKLLQKLTFNATEHQQQNELMFIQLFLGITTIFVVTFTIRQITIATEAMRGICMMSAR